MKIFSIGILLMLIGISDCLNHGKQPYISDNNNETAKIKVGIFDKNGDSPECITDAVEALRIDTGIITRIISASEIISGSANDIDLFLFPGGSGRSETGSLGELGQEKIIDLVRNKGKGIIGICAGAYILTQTPEYPSLALNGAEAIDIEHDHRGHGLVQFSLTEKGKKIFPELQDKQVYYCQYYEGPVLIPASNSNVTYEELATMKSDVHLIEGSPENMTNNRPFIILSKAGKGKTASFVGHPESTPGMRWMIPRMVRIVLEKKIISYNPENVKPDIYSKEILFTPELLKKQKEAFDKLTGPIEEKISAMDDLHKMCAWSAKKWIPPMIRDKDFKVRLHAAKLIVAMGQTNAIPDIESAITIEKEIKQKELLSEQLSSLKKMIGK